VGGASEGRAPTPSPVPHPTCRYFSIWVALKSGFHGPLPLRAFKPFRSHSRVTLVAIMNPNTASSISLPMADAPDPHTVHSLGCSRMYEHTRADKDARGTPKRGQ
jgi:hypothetical protein